jgi:hypothetical protein
MCDIVCTKSVSTSQVGDKLFRLTLEHHDTRISPVGEPKMAVCLLLVPRSRSIAKSSGRRLDFF